MRSRRILVPALALALTACGGDNFQDLRDFMKHTADSLPRQIDPLPAAKTYEPFSYDDFAMADPFKPRPLSTDTARATGENAPDTRRAREALERYPLDSLRMVGTLQQKAVTYALIRADGTLYRVKPGDHIGLDYGVITAISEAEVTLRENIQDAAGEWTLRLSRLPLAEGAQETRK